MKLGADQAGVSVRDPSQFLIVCKSLLAVKAVSKAGGQPKIEIQNDIDCIMKKSSIYSVLPGNTSCYKVNLSEAEREDPLGQGESQRS